MKKKLFGNNIDCSCEYCSNAKVLQDDKIICKKGKHIGKDGICRSFDYDPLKRTPKSKPLLPKYDPSDFSL